MTPGVVRNLGARRGSGRKRYVAVNAALTVAAALLACVILGAIGVYCQGFPKKQYQWGVVNSWLTLPASSDVRASSASSPAVSTCRPNGHNPLNDIALISASLRQLGFKVTEIRDANYRAMETAVIVLDG